MIWKGNEFKNFVEKKEKKMVGKSIAEGVFNVQCREVLNEILTLIFSISSAVIIIMWSVISQLIFDMLDHYFLCVLHTFEYFKIIW